MGRKYEPLANGAEDGGDDCAASLRLEAAKTLERRAKRFMYTGVVALIISLFALMGAAVVRRPSMLDCDKMVSPWSSLWPAVEHTEGDLINYFNHSSIYRGPPTLERETAWNTLWYRMLT
ncbi:hypothetical protein BM221_005183 [Beauveria bassiana]|uniref:Uncharacterized protein n=1 Tax=Beauveria bassiana TaxID=176275 RepID=A0A2N6NMV4_BEABA|nr:hypothetical protein BM221_005183 [Beauveria bassiana]